MFAAGFMHKIEQLLYCRYDVSDRKLLQVRCIRENRIIAAGISVLIRQNNYRRADRMIATYMM
jgi:hypothetical protein